MCEPDIEVSGGLWNLHSGVIPLERYGRIVVSRTYGEAADTTDRVPRHVDGSGIPILNDEVQLSEHRAGYGRWAAYRATGIVVCAVRECLLVISDANGAVILA